MSALTMATFRTGSREAKNSIRLSMRMNPPISFATTSNKVETSGSGGWRKSRMIMGLPLKMIKRPPAAVNKEKIPKRIRRPR